MSDIKSFVFLGTDAIVERAMKNVNGNWVMWEDCEKEITRLTAENEKAKELLEIREWNDCGMKRCFYCGQYEYQGHSTDCKLFQFISKE